MGKAGFPLNEIDAAIKFILDKWYSGWNPKKGWSDCKTLQSKLQRLVAISSARRATRTSRFERQFRSVLPLLLFSIKDFNNLTDPELIALYQFTYVTFTSPFEIGYMTPLAVPEKTVSKLLKQSPRTKASLPLEANRLTLLYQDVRSQISNSLRGGAPFFKL